MQLKDIMTKEIEYCHPDCALREAAEKMKLHNVGAMPICDGDRIRGILTDRDITVRAIAEGRDPNSTKVRDIMTHEVTCAYEDQGLQEAAMLMELKRVRRLPVLNRSHQLVGIVSIDDLEVQARQMEKLASEVLAGVAATGPGH